MILQDVRELYQFRELLITWTIRELKLRYKQSLMGGLWAILQPMLLTVLFVIIFSIFVQLPTDGIPHPIFAYAALVPWTYFATSLTFSVASLVNNMNLVTKIYFPREILPLATICATLVDFGVASLVLVVLMLIYRTGFHITLLWVPVLVIIQTILIAGVAFYASMLNAFYRDLRFIIPLLVQAWMYASPIIYPLSVVPEKLRPFYLLNPMAGLIDAYRRVILLGTAPDPLGLGLACLVTLVLSISGYRYFKRSEGNLPDVI